MNNVAILRSKVKKSIWLRLEALANKEVGKARFADVRIDPSYSRSKYHSIAYMFPDTVGMYAYFYGKQLKVTPWDVFNVLFRCKLAQIVGSPDEFDVRSGGGSLFSDGCSFAPTVADMKKPYDTYLIERLETLQVSADSGDDKAVIVPVWNFDCFTRDIDNFADEMEKRFPGFLFLFTNARLVKLQKHLDRGMPKAHYNVKEARRLLLDLSGKVFGIAYVGQGTDDYVTRYGMVTLKVICDLFRIFGFIYPYQRDSGGDREFKYEAPIGHSFITARQRSHGCFLWHEEKKPLVDRSPDGNLHISFGFRSIAKLHIDNRTYASFLAMFDESKSLTDLALYQPYSEKFTGEVLPVLHLLSTASQAQDWGTKILLIMCCLEHMYTIGRFEGIQNIIDRMKPSTPKLTAWAEELYRLRCDYAHNGYLSGQTDLHAFVADSMKNCLELLRAKL